MYVRARGEEREKHVDVSQLSDSRFVVRVVAHESSSRHGESIVDRLSPATRGVDLHRSLRPAERVERLQSAEFTPSQFHSLSHPSAGAPQMGREARFART